MGDTGPCGPVPKFMDCRTDDERKVWMENTGEQRSSAGDWNEQCVIQFNRLKDGSLEPLPARHVDTGKGLKRLVRVLQNKQSNYDTDIFSGTIAATEKLVGKTYKAVMIKKALPSCDADHIRAICFTIADGQLPSNTGCWFVWSVVFFAVLFVIIILTRIISNLTASTGAVKHTQFETVFPELQEAFFVLYGERRRDDFYAHLTKV